MHQRNSFQQARTRFGSKILLIPQERHAAFERAFVLLGQWVQRVLAFAEQVLGADRDAALPRGLEGHADAEAAIGLVLAGDFGHAADQLAGNAAGAGGELEAVGVPLGRQATWNLRGGHDARLRDVPADADPGLLTDRQLAADAHAFLLQLRAEAQGVQGHAAAAGIVHSTALCTGAGTDRGATDLVLADGGEAVLIAATQLGETTTTERRETGASGARAGAEHPERGLRLGNHPGADGLLAPIPLQRAAELGALGQQSVQAVVLSQLLAIEQEKCFHLALGIPDRQIT